MDNKVVTPTSDWNLLLIGYGPCCHKTLRPYSRNTKWFTHTQVCENIFPFTMLSNTPSLTILTEEQKFNGENLLSWTMNMTQLLGSKGLSGYVDGRIPLPLNWELVPLFQHLLLFTLPTQVLMNGTSMTNWRKAILPLTAVMLLHLVSTWFPPSSTITLQASSGSA